MQEHAWHAALMTILLSEYANEPIDVLKTVTMLLIHDIVEIDAGDTYAYDEAGIATQAERSSRRRSAFLVCCRKNRHSVCWSCGRSLRPKKQQRLALPRDG